MTVADNLVITPELAKTQRGELVKKAKGTKNKTQIELAKKVEEDHPEDTHGVDKQTLELLDEPELNALYLDLGYNKDYWYYGLNLNGREAIFTSDNRILRNTEEKIQGRTIGENLIKKEFVYSGYIGDIAPLVPKQLIKKIIIKEVNERLGIRDCFDKIREQILYYMDFQKQKIIASIQSCWVIATYCYPLFYWFPHLLFNCPSESGKSKNAFILMQMSFRGFDLGTSGGVTPAQIFRTLDGNRGTIVIDEFERQDNSESYKLVTQILNASCTKDAYVIRTEQIDRKWKAWKFPIFCPKIVCNITGINPTSLNRFIVFRFLKNNSEKSKRKPYKEKDKEKFEPIRNDLYLLILKDWKKIKDTYDNLVINLRARDEDNWLPILAIAKLCGDDVFEGILKYIDEYQEIKIQNNDLVVTLFYKMYENLTEEKQIISVKNISSWMEGELPSSYESPESWIGRRLHDFEFKSKRLGVGKVYELSKFDVKNIIDRYFPLSTEEGSQDTLDTQDTEDTQGTQKNSEPYVCSEPIPEVDYELIIKEKNNKYPISEFIEKYGLDVLNKLKNEGLVAEFKSGFLSIVQEVKVIQDENL